MYYVYFEFVLLLRISRARGVTVNTIDGVTTSNNSYPSLFLAYIVQEYTDKVNYRQVSKYVLVSGFTARSPLCNYVVGVACRLTWRMSRLYYASYYNETILSWYNDHDNESPLTFLSDPRCVPTLSTVNPVSDVP